MPRKPKKTRLLSFQKVLKTNILIYCAVLLLLIKILVMGSSLENFFLANISKTNLISLVNQSRELAGVDVLTENEQLDQAAYLKAQNMIQEQYFNHTSPSGVNPWYWFSKAGYDYKYAGENLAIGFFDSREVYDAWLNSPSHRENLLNPAYKEIGMAVMDGFGNNNTTIVVQLFGTPKTSSVLTKNSLTVNNTSAKVTPQEQPAIPETASAESISTTSQNQRATSQFVLGEQKSNVTTTFYSRIASYVLYDSKNLANGIIYGWILIILGILGLGIVANSGHLSRSLTFKSILIVVILALAVVADKNVFVSLVPHQTKI